MKAASDLVGRLAMIQQKAKQQAERAPAPADSPKSNVVQLPLWPDVVRGVPNGVLRSALFGAVKRGPRRYMQSEQIAALDGIEIRYTGQRLDQGDLDVWESVLHIARLQALGEQCRFTAYSMLKLLGKTDTGKNRATLQTRIERLRANAINIKQGRYLYIGGLVDEAFKDEETQEWVIGLNSKLRALFAADQFTQIDWSVRHALDGKPLAQWLHGYYASHAKPYPVSVAKLQALCGSEGELRRFRQTLADALDDVAAASVANGQLFSFEVSNDLVHVEKKGSAPQRRHLTNKAKLHRRGP